MRKKDNNLNRGRRSLVYELLPRGIYSKRLREQSASVCLLSIISSPPLAIAVLVRHPRHVRFYRSVTIVTGGFRTVIFTATLRSQSDLKEKKSNDNAVTRTLVAAM